MSAAQISLSHGSLSLDRARLIDLLVERENVLIIQDLDGVCMGLVNDPLTRAIDPEYLKATQAFDGHFYVLTNGEHIGKRGINSIVERAFDSRDLVKKRGFYLPGLAGGGVQWQDRYGNVSHPGVSAAELAFLAEVPQEMRTYLEEFLSQYNDFLDRDCLETSIEAAVLDNYVSPTVNLNVFHQILPSEDRHIYLQLQQAVKVLMERLQEKAKQKGLSDSFFVHYAPNLGKHPNGGERLQLAQGKDSGTTDFQFMLRGAIKEAGVLAILNRYYHQRTGSYPLGESFSVRSAPHNHRALLELIEDRFEPLEMPTIVGVGDTVTSKAREKDGKLEFQRGGSDRGFLHLIQDIGRKFETENVTVYVDSSGGEVKNRKPLKLEPLTCDPDSTQWRAIEGPGDPRDLDDPLTLNVAFPEGHQQYIQFFRTAAERRKIN